MSLWTSIRDSVRKVTGTVLSSGGGGIFGGALGGTVGTVLGGAIMPSSGRSNILPAVQAPSDYRGPGGIPKSGLEGKVERVLPGGESGYHDPRKFKVGKLSGKTIPRGYVERMSKQGVIYLARPRRRRGITARDLATYRRVDRVLKTYAKKRR